MEMNGHRRIAAPREKVYGALNDPEILKQSIPGCKEITSISDTELTAKIAVKIGPVKANFAGKVMLSDLVPPESYKISGKGSGGAAGFAKGSAEVKLLADGSATELHYNVHADVGGKLAQLGGRLIDGTAKKLTDQFFENFSALVGQPDAETERADEETVPPAPAESARLAGRSHLVWIVTAAVIAAGLIGLALFVG